MRDLGFKHFGANVKVSRKSSFYNPKNITLGNNARIDDFTVLSCGDTGTIYIGDYVHISTHCLVIAAMEVRFEDFSGISSGCKIFGCSDDYSGEFLTNPSVPLKFRKCNAGPVILKKHAVVGAGTTILYDVTIGECSAVGAMSLVVRGVPSGEIHAGVPARFVKMRSKKALDLETEFRSEQ